MRSDLLSGGLALEGSQWGGTSLTGSDGLMEEDLGASTVRTPHTCQEHVKWRWIPTLLPECLPSQHQPPTASRYKVLSFGIVLKGVRLGMFSSFVCSLPPTQRVPWQTDGDSAGLFTKLTKGTLFK